MNKFLLRSVLENTKDKTKTVTYKVYDFDYLKTQCDKIIGNMKLSNNGRTFQRIEKKFNEFAEKRWQAAYGPSDYKETYEFIADDPLLNEIPSGTRLCFTGTYVDENEIEGRYSFEDLVDRLKTGSKEYKYVV